MEFEKIGKKSTVAPGEYLLHSPSRQIVLCGAYKPNEGKIKALVNGRLMEDNIENFQKIKLTRKEKAERTRPSCGGCKKR